VWTIAEPQVQSKIIEAMASRKIFMADGHHRYEAALRYRDELSASEGPLPANSAARYVMMTLISMDDPGLLLQPFHRLFGCLNDAELALLRSFCGRSFEVDTLEVSPTSAEDAASAIEARLAAHSPNEVLLAAMGFEPGKAHLLTMPEAHGQERERPVLESCDTWALHRKVIAPALGTELERASVSFVQDTVEAVHSVQSGRKQVAFLSRSLPMDLFEEVVRNGARLPPKSTCFYPKLPTGLVINSLEGEL